METNTKAPIAFKTFSERIIDYINHDYDSSDFKQGYLSSLRKIKRKINAGSTYEEVRIICEERRNNIYSRIDERTGGDPMDRRDEMTKYEKGALVAACGVLNHALKEHRVSTFSSKD